MKLFTKDINQKLFAQYRIGSNLNKQKVIAKIFNPYGRGRWYLLNSDPNAPDYLWAIVQMGDEVEIGSVSRSQLESFRVKPHGLPLERDMYFSERNAMEVLDGLEKGKTFASGGMVPGRYYKDNSGNELRFIGEDSDGQLLFKDGDKLVKKSEDDFDGGKEEFKVFKFFKDGGEMDDGGIIEIGSEGMYRGGAAKVLKYDDKNKMYAIKYLNEDGEIDGDFVMARKDDFEYGFSDFDPKMAGGGEVPKYSVTFQYESKSKRAGWASFDSEDIYVDAKSSKEAKEKAIKIFNDKHPNIVGKITNINDNKSTFLDNANLADGGKVENKPFFRDRTAKLREPFNKGFEGLANATGHGALTKYGKMAKGGELTDFKKEAILKKKGNIIIFKELLQPTDEGRKSIAVQGFVKSRKTGAVKIEGSAYDTQWFSSMQDLINAVDWSKWEKDKMAMGGKVTFNEKVKAIQKKLIANKKVPKSVQKDYGKTFTKDEAKESAQRIVGAMVKKGMK